MEAKPVEEDPKASSKTQKSPNKKNNKIINIDYKAETEKAKQ
jgi:hypothetical protein